MPSLSEFTILSILESRYPKMSDEDMSEEYDLEYSEAEPEF